MAYSDEEQAEAIIRLAINKYDYDKTAEETGVSARTIRRWTTSVPKKTVGELLDRAIQRLLMIIPKDWNGKDWAITVGILMDKWLLMRGQPTARTESVLKQLGNLSDEERQRAVDDAKRILDEIARRDSGGGGGDGSARPSAAVVQ